ncbi:hypothetical protein L1887_19684 [Cichorium endivia]|nr:hypothetical protein L1887_19684 [Cichorium endivia]
MDLVPSFNRATSASDNKSGYTPRFPLTNLTIPKPKPPFHETQICIPAIPIQPLPTIYLHWNMISELMGFCFHQIRYLSSLFLLRERLPTKHHQRNSASFIHL